MRRLIVLCLALAAIVTTSLIYHMKYDTRDLSTNVRKLERSVERKRAAIATLEAELSFLTAPERLDPLARERLGMRPEKPGDAISVTGPVPAPPAPRLPEGPSSPVIAALQDNKGEGEAGDEAAVDAVVAATRLAPADGTPDDRETRDDPIAAMLAAPELAMGENVRAPQVLQNALPARRTASAPDEHQADAFRQTPGHVAARAAMREADRLLERGAAPSGARP